MSRMLAYFGCVAATVTEAVGVQSAERFAALARVHSDGWGTAWTDGTDSSPRLRRDPAALDPTTPWGVTAPERAGGRVLYLRFASRGAAVALENVQPFVARGVAFEHNGALAPRDRALSLLSPAGRAVLCGTTDSEVYFQLALDLAGDAQARPGAGRGGLLDTASFVTGLLAAVRALRALFPEACLNAFALTRDALIIVQAAGTVAPPLAAFSARGHDLDALPPGHDESYNTLFAQRSADRVVVATSGVPLSNAHPLPAESLTVISAAAGELSVVSRSLIA